MSGDRVAALRIVLPACAAEAPPDNGNSMPQMAREKQGEIAGTGYAQTAMWQGRPRPCRKAEAALPHLVCASKWKGLR